MGTNRVKAVAALESPASSCVSIMELWDGVSQVVWHHQCGGLAGRSWVVCALALPPHRRVGLASVPAHQSGRQGASPGSREVHLALEVGSPNGQCVVWSGGLLCAKHAALHVAGSLG